MLSQLLGREVHQHRLSRKNRPSYRKKYHVPWIIQFLPSVCRDLPLSPFGTVRYSVHAWLTKSCLKVYASSSSPLSSPKEARCAAREDSVLSIDCESLFNCLTILLNTQSPSPETRSAVSPNDARFLVRLLRWLLDNSIPLLWYVNNSCVNTLRQHFPWSILYVYHPSEKNVSFLSE